MTRINRSMARLTAVAALAAAALVGVATPAAAAAPGGTAGAISGATVSGAAALSRADDPTLVERLKAELIRRIDLRLAALRRYGAAVDVAQHLTDAHEATLDRIIARDIEGLTALRAKVATETTLAALRADAVSMVNDYRVFLLVGPQVRLSIAGDSEQAVANRLRTAHRKLTELVARAKQAGEDTAAAEQDLADMDAALDRAEAHLAGQVDKLLAIQPGPDAAAILAKIGEVRRALGAARIDLRTALGPSTWRSS